MICNCSKEDIAIINSQLGRAPEGIIEATKRCVYGFPQVIMVFPYIDGRGLFPTLYWLTCPHLRKSVANLENNGFIAAFRDMIIENCDFRDKLISCDKLYREERVKIVKHLDEDGRVSQKDLALLSEVGIGGCKDTLMVRCLHMHVAHYLASGDNPIGEKCIDNLTTCEKGIYCDDLYCNKKLS